MMKQQRGAVRAVLNMSLFVLLLLSGLLCSASGLWREYNYINQRMMWTEAQSYCRLRFTDLATVDSIDDVNMMMNTVNDGYNGSVWIGLKQGTQGRWCWSDGNDTLTQYSAWWPGEPSGEGQCVYFLSNYWMDYPCEVLLYFMCYDENIGNIMIPSVKNWRDAQSYCRQYHTDLATAHSAEEQKQIYDVVGDAYFVWIGLFLDSWQWSDQWNFSFKNWAAGQQFQTSGDCVAMSTDSGKWVRYSCYLKHPFICYGEDKLVKKQTFRINFSHDGKSNLNDSSIQTAILNEISNKLNIMGLESYRNISWRKDEAGEVFHLNSKCEYTVNSNDECDE